MKLTDSCLLVSLSISSYNGTKTDKALTREAIASHGTKSDSLRVVKRLVSDESIKGFKKIESEARVYHRDNTLPWLDDGQRILPQTNYQKYMEVMRQKRDEHEVASNDFIGKWPQIIQQAQIDLNGTFNADDYPDALGMRSCFKFRIGCQQVPDGADIRVAIPQAEIQQIREDMEERVSQAERMAVNDLFRRLAEPLAAMSSKLHEEKAIFRDTLVTNIHEIVNLIPALNISGDPRLERIRNQVMADLGSVRPDDLRDDKLTRKTTASKVDAILSQMSEHYEVAA